MMGRTLCVVLGLLALNAIAAEPAAAIEEVDKTLTALKAQAPQGCEAKHRAS